MPQPINTSAARNNLSDLINQAYYNGRSFMLEKLGKPQAVIMGIDEYQKYQKLRKVLFSEIDIIAEDNKSFSEKEVITDLEEERRKIYRKNA